VGFVVYKVALGQVFSEYFGYPCQTSFHQLLHYHHPLSSGAGTTGQAVAAVPSGLSLTPLKIIINNNKTWKKINKLETRISGVNQSLTLFDTTRRA
jgi:hypothetical protein